MFEAIKCVRNPWLVFFPFKPTTTVSAVAVKPWKRLSALLLLLWAEGITKANCETATVQCSKVPRCMKAGAAA